MSKIKAIYLRVSTTNQDHASQEPDLESWAHGKDRVKWFRDKASGKSMDRPAWKELMDLVRRGKVSEIVVWRLDRLGRTASGLTSLFDELIALGVNLISICDSVNLQTPAGRLIANVLASVSQYETEVRRERVTAGIHAAKSKGKTWGGSKKGVRRKATSTHVDVALQLNREGVPVQQISQALGLSRKTIYSILREGA